MIGIDEDSEGCNVGIMKTTIDIPENELKDAMRFTGAKTKRMAINTAVADFNRRQRMATLTRHLGTCRNMMTLCELERMRRGIDVT